MILMVNVNVGKYSIHGFYRVYTGDLLHTCTPHVRRTTVNNWRFLASCSDGFSLLVPRGWEEMLS